MERRFAFTAQFWGKGVVVCRAIEDRQQFGDFPTWTQANNFASKLNEGLDLGHHEVRQIVTSSFLATAAVIQEALNSKKFWIGSSAERSAREAQLRFVISELKISLTLRRTAALLSEAALLCTFAYAQKALHHTTRLLMSFGGNYGEMEGVVQSAEALQEALQSPPPAIAAKRGS